MQDPINFERHLQSAIAILMIGIVVWVGVTLLDNSNTLARLDERVVNLGRDIDSLKLAVDQRMADWFTGKEGQFHAQRLDSHETRIEALQKHMRECEHRLDRVDSGNGNP